MTDPAHDKDLLRRIGTGDRAAMREFYTSHQRGLTAFARARGMDVATAADVVQDTMLDVWRSAGRYRGDAAAKTWLFTIAHNKIVDRVRKNARVQYV
ncbi:MAG: RNA polymerase sigma factor, partial [Tateyamaria sp.]